MVIRSAEKLWRSRWCFCVFDLPVSGLGRALRVICSSAELVTAWHEEDVEIFSAPEFSTSKHRFTGQWEAEIFVYRSSCSRLCKTHASIVDQLTSS